MVTGPWRPRDRRRNKGPMVVSTVEFLANVLERMALLRKLSVSEI